MRNYFRTVQYDDIEHPLIVSNTTKTAINLPYNKKGDGSEG